MATPTGYRQYPNDEAKAKLYNHRLAIADEVHDTEKGNIEDWWHRYENLPRKSTTTPKGHRINVPTGVAVIDSLFSALTATEVDPLVKRMGGASRLEAELATAALKQEWDLLDASTETDTAIKEALVAGIGFVKVGYEYRSEVVKVPRPVEAIRAEIIELLKEASAYGKDAPHPDDIAAGVPLEEEVERVLRDRIVLDYVPWEDVRYDSNAKRWGDVTWVAVCMKVKRDDVVNDPRYREYAKNKTGATRRLNEVKATKSFETSALVGGKPTDDDEYCEVIQMTDLQTGTVCEFVKGEKFLLLESANPFALRIDYEDRNPFVPVIFRETATRVRGISDMELVAPSLDEQSRYRSNVATFVERFVPKVIGPEDALTTEGKAALASPEYGAYVSIAREFDGSAVTPMSPPVLPSEVFGLEERVEQSTRDATGVNELMRGLFPDRKRTATETSEVVSASAARQSEKRNRLERFYIDIMERMLLLMQMYYDQPRMLTYVDPTIYGEVQWEFSNDDLIQEYKLGVRLTPKEPETKQDQRDDALAYFNYMLPLATQPQPDGSYIVDAAKLAAWFSAQFGIERSDVLDMLNLPEEKQAQQLAAQQAAAGQASAAQGAVAPDLTSGPLDAGEVAALTNQGAVPPDVAAAAVGGIGPGAPAAVEQLSESAGVRVPGQ